MFDCQKSINRIVCKIYIMANYEIILNVQNFLFQSLEFAYTSCLKNKIITENNIKSNFNNVNV